MSIISRVRTDGAAAWRAAARRPVPGAVVLAYHDVLPDAADPFPYAVTRAVLARQLDVVARTAQQVVPLGELAARHGRGEDLSGLVAVVFDDALVGVHQLALPELARRGWPATLLPVVDRLGVQPPWWPGSRRTMTAAELAEAAAAGVELAAHGTTHACLPCLDDRALREELTRSREHLAALTGAPAHDLAYPYGHHDARVRDAVRAAGFRTGWTFLNGRVTTTDGPLLLPRLTMHQGLTPTRLAVQLGRRPRDWPDPALPEVHPHVLSPR